MTVVTKSGYPVIYNYGDPRIVKVSPVNAAPGVLDGPVAIVLGWVMAQFDKTVMPLIPSQCWGFAPRQIRGGTGWSNHASATAVDLNATVFPQGKYHMSKAQRGACRQIVKQSSGVIRWGGDYSGSTAVDEQHFEIAPGMAGTGRVEALAARIVASRIINQLEWIMSLPGAPSGLTYRQFLNDIRNTILDTPLNTTDYSVRPPKARRGTIRSVLKDVSNFASGSAYNAGQASLTAGKALKELQEGMNNA